MTKILLLVLLCLTHQAFSGLILHQVTFANQPTPESTTSEPTTTQTSTDASVTTTDDSASQTTTDTTQTAPAPTGIEVIESEPPTTTSTSDPILIAPQQPKVVVEPEVVIAIEPVKEESLSSDSKEEKQTNNKPEKKGKGHQKHKCQGHNHHMSCKRAIQGKELSLLAQERIHLIDFPSFDKMKSAERVVVLKQQGNYELTFTTLTLEPKRNLNAVNPDLEVIINGETHQIQLGYNESELSFVFAGHVGVNHVKFTIKGDESSKVPTQTMLTDFKVILQ